MAKFECYLLKTNADIASQTREFLERLYVGGKFVPPYPTTIQTCKIFFARVRCIIFKLGNFTKLKVLFPEVFKIFPNWSLSKVEKYLEG